MKGTQTLLCCFLILFLTYKNAFSNISEAVLTDALTKQIEIMVQELKKSNDYADRITKQMGVLSRQVMLQQSFVEERLRSEGQSGIKQIRNGAGGTKSYHSASHVGKRVASIHDHSNNIRTVGMGEYIGVLNGVEFRTRHNDYRLYMPSKSGNDYHKTEDIPFPNVPPEVEEKKDVEEQVKEMVKWFQAWKDGNYTERDYRKYFRPVLCYLEGTWTKSAENIDEPFESDRHFIDANSWFDLQEKIRFTSYTGRKDNFENFAYLPTTILGIENDTFRFAQWNYRILCHPLKTDVPLNRFRMIDDLGSRLTHHHTVEEQAQTRAARFQVNSEDSDTWDDRASSKFGFLDKLMSEIPGKDNYPTNLTDNAFDNLAYTMDPEKNNEPLNVGYYHRWYKVLQKGAMGIQTRCRGFSDPNLFMAMNTQDKVAGMTLNVCKRKICVKQEQKWSYAIPLEILYLTPLNEWNPYNLKYKGEFDSTEGKTVKANKRNGGHTKEKAFDGVNSKTYYRTPNELFAGTETHKDAADTTRQSVGVLDPTGEVRKVRASGIRIFLPNIPGVGILRQRYPIMPVHAEGSTTWKELEAVQDFLMESNTHARLFREKLATQSDSNGGIAISPEVNTDTRLQTGLSSKFGISPHTNEITLTAKELHQLKNGRNVDKVTNQVQGHQHVIKVSWNKENDVFYISWCDESKQKMKGFRNAFRKYQCEDKHGSIMKPHPDQ